MGMETNLTLLRKSQYLKIDDNIKAKIDETLNRYTNGGLVDADVGKRPIPRFIAISHRLWYDSKNKELYDEVLNRWWTSSFQELVEHWHLSYDEQHMVTVEEAESICRAAKYLLLGNYSKEFEEVLGSEFVGALKDQSLDYLRWNRSKGLNLYFERESPECWRLSSGNDGYDDSEERDAGRGVLEDLVKVCGEYVYLVDRASWDYDSSSGQKDEYVLIYDM